MNPDVPRPKRALLAPALVVVLGLIALVALIVPIWVATHPVATPHRIHRRPPAVHVVVPQNQLPAVEPVELTDLNPDEARTFNASVPFIDGPIPAARPFHISGAADSIARATDCLAAAVIYEAGDDAPGEQAVAQVILNRLRHPAFPKTVCGVVFEGSERSTGCQFTFSCDGSLDRWKPTPAAWARARYVAGRALAGFVYKPVGYATHYHTDWVVPYWRASLDKIAAVHTQLFYRWTGWWGTPPAFNRQVLANEPVIAALAPLSPVHAGPPTPDGTLPPTIVDDAPTPAPTLAPPIASGEAVLPAPISGDRESFLVTLDPRLPPEQLPAFAQRVCGERISCKLMSWTKKSETPSAVPLDANQVATMAFSYMRDRPTGFEKALWNCDLFPRPDEAQCMKRQVLGVSGRAPQAASSTPAAPTELSGVRRKAAVSSSPAPAASAPSQQGAPKAAAAAH